VSDGSTANLSSGQTEKVLATNSSTVNIGGDVIVGRFEIASGSVVDMSGGVVGVHSSINHARWNISGGRVDGELCAWVNSTVNISGGSIGGKITASDRAAVNISGGKIDGGFLAKDTARVDVSGGGFTDGFVAVAGSALKLRGTDFRIDNEIVSGLQTIGNSIALDLPAGAVLSGTFADGTPFAFTSLDKDLIANGTLTLVRSAEAPQGPPIIQLPGDIAPLGIRAGQTLRVANGSTLPANFNAGFGSVVEITGGNVGDNLEAVGTSLTISGGTIGRYLGIFTESTMQISGGEIGSDMVAAGNSNMDISGGTIGSFFRLLDGSTANISGGQIAGDFQIESDSTVNISGGSVGTSMRALSGSTVNVSGGAIGFGFGVAGESTANISGGTIGDRFRVVSGSVANISAGTIGDDLEVFSTVNISGGSIGSNLKALGGSVVNLSGGSIHEAFQAISGSTVNVSGGDLGSGVDADGGSILDFTGGTVGDHFNAKTGAIITLGGSGFALDGVPIGGLEDVGNSVSIDIPDGGLLTGTLADGTPLAFSSLDDDHFAAATLTLVRSADPPPGPALIQLPGDTAPWGIRSGQTLTVNDSGFVGRNFNAGAGSMVQVLGGSVGDNLEVVGAEVTIAAGNVGNDFDAFHGSTIQLSGGAIGDRMDAFAGSTVSISGGQIGDDFDAHGESTVDISGGGMGGELTARAGSSLTLRGQGFQLNGQPISGLDQVNDSVLIDLPADGVLTGTLADGTSFGYASPDGDNIADGTLTLVRSPEPPTEPALFELPGDTPPVGVRREQTLNLANGGVLPRNFNAGVGSVVNISGGNVEENFEAVGGEVNISGGTVAAGFDALAGSTVNITGGIVGDGLDAFAGSTVNIRGGEVGNRFNAQPLSVVNISGGTVGYEFEAHEGSTVNISDGTVNNQFHANSGSTVNITGGSVGDQFKAFSGAAVNISGGTVGNNFQAGGRESTVMITGGTIGSFFTAGSNVHISGGRVGRNLQVAGAVVISGGTVADRMESKAGSSLTIRGVDFHVDGQPIPGLDEVGATVDFEIPSDGLLSGTLADGTPFALASQEFDRVSSLVLSRSEQPAPGPALIQLPGDTAPLGVRAGQVLNVEDGGALRDDFNAGRGSTVNIRGGAVGENFEAVGAEVNISGGTVGDFLDAFAGATINVSGGNVGRDFDAYAGSVVNVTGGWISSDFDVIGATVNVSGGTISSSFDAFSGAEVNISGGTLHSARALNGSVINVSGGMVTGPWQALEGALINISGGNLGSDLETHRQSNVRFSGGTMAKITAFTGSSLNIQGHDFRIDGQIVEGLDRVDDMVSIDVPTSAVLSGILADGTPFAFSGLDGDRIDAGTLTLLRTAAAAPGAAVIQLPGDTAPYGIRAGQTLNVGPGGELPSHFNAGPGSVVNVAGGVVGVNLEATGSEINIAGGTVESGLDAFDGAVVNISGGSVVDSFDAYSGAIVNLSGGDGIGPKLRVFPDSTVNVFGLDFLLNGAPINGLENWGDSVIIPQRDGSTLRTTLLDGNVFNLRPQSRAGGTSLRHYVDPEATLRLVLGAVIGIPGDTNGDGSVDIDDINAVRNHFGSVGLADGSLQGDSYPFDGIVNIDDLNLIRNNFGIRPVPEPSTRWLAAIAIAVLWTTLRRSKSCRSRRRRDLICRIVGLTP